ncbi:MAG: glycoside hydrolase family 97 protein [Bacteroidaceae bacterium]|nr:glycoside hydrolase family 97 protein [Bacteroidaceae bacterium]MBQ9642289.1 glycoside hydrolase family 97 protein [Bacteroidaceae bacterium]
MKHLSTILFLLATTLSLKATPKGEGLERTFTSPDGRLNISIQASNGLLTYSITEAGTIYAKDNAIALQFEGVAEGKYTAVSAPKRVKEHFNATNYKFTTFDDEYNQVVVKNRNGVNVEFRAYNSGVAYRFFTTATKKDWKVLNEVAQFNFSADHTAYLPYSTNPKNPKAMAFQATYDVAPLSQTQHLEAFLPATVDCGTAKVTLFETDVESYPGMFLLPANGKGTYGLQGCFAPYPKTFDYYPWRVQKYVKETEKYIAQGRGNRTFPWRVVAITHSDTEMPTHTLAYQLASPSRIKGDQSWIRPGKVAWDWWNDWGIAGVSFKAGINQDTYKYYIDFAAKNHLQYIILDEGWYNPKSGDMLSVIPALNLPELVQYGQQRGVGIILWTVFNVLDAQLDEACSRYAAMGIKGFKVDFMDRYDQEATDMIYRIARRCAESHLVLDYHGIFAPQGITRTWPNVINFEAVFGMEEVKWTERDKAANVPSKDMPQYDVTFPYIRGMVGPVDFTPGGMRNATRADFQPIYNNPLTMGTRCHQLACYIVHESPLTMLADNPTAYMQEQPCTDFIASLPTTYDEMCCIDGKMGQYIVIARRQGNDWYIGAQTNWDAHDIQLDLSFLPAGNYRVTTFADGPNADHTATDYRQQQTTLHAPSAPQTIHLASGGGLAMKLIKE